MNDNSNLVGRGIRAYLTSERKAGREGQQPSNTSATFTHEGTEYAVLENADRFLGAYKITENRLSRVTGQCEKAIEIAWNGLGSRHPRKPIPASKYAR